MIWQPKITVHGYQEPLKNECNIKDDTNHFQEAPEHKLPTNTFCPERKIRYLMFSMNITCIFCQTFRHAEAVTTSAGGKWDMQNTNFLQHITLNYATVRIRSGSLFQLHLQEENRLIRNKSKINMKS